MADANNGKAVEDTETIVLPQGGGDESGEDADGDEFVVPPQEGDEGAEGAAEGAPAAEGAEGEGEEGDDPADASPDGRKEQIVHRQPNQAVNDGGDDTGDGGGNATVNTNGLTEDDLKPLPNETPRERALRLEVTRTKRLLREDRRNEIMGANAPAPASQKKELTAEQKAVLGKYTPEEIASLREVLPVLADEMGYVRGDQLQAGTYAEKASGELDNFLSDHPEYLPENDNGNVLWDRFKEQFSMYKQPSNPKDYRKIFNRIHTEVFGIQPANGSKKGQTDAQRHKVGAGSQRGSSGPATAPRQTTRAAPAASGLRLDMLKGFDADELAELEAEA